MRRAYTCGVRSAQSEGNELATAAQKVMFKQVLQQARADAGLSQRALAQLLNVSGATVALWETGETAPRVEMTAKLEKALEVEAGTFARLLGYLPMGVQTDAMISVLEAIKADKKLEESDRALLATMYREILKQRRK